MVAPGSLRDLADRCGYSWDPSIAQSIAVMDETDEFKVAFRQSGYGTTIRGDTSVTCVDGGAGDANVTLVK